MSLDDSELDNDLASLPASRETRWEQVYVDGDTKLVQRGGSEASMHDFNKQDTKEIYITPGTLDIPFVGSKSNDSTPLNLSTAADILPVQPQLTPTYGQDAEHGRSIANKASFSDRVHQLTQTQTEDVPSKQSQHGRDAHQAPDTTFLAELEHEFEYDSAPSSLAPSRVGTGFSIFDRPERNYRVGTGFTTFSAATGFNSPLRQDTGFDDPAKTSYESEQPNKTTRTTKKAMVDGEKINEKLWESTGGTAFGFGEGVRGHELLLRDKSAVLSTTSAIADSAAAQNDSIPITIGATAPSISPTLLSLPKTRDKAIEEKTSNTTIRPLSSSQPTPTPAPTLQSTTQTVPHAAPLHTPAAPQPHHDTKAVFEPPATPQYEHEYFQRSRTNSDLNNKSSRDLDDYLNSSIE